MDKARVAIRRMKALEAMAERLAALEEQICRVEAKLDQALAAQANPPDPQK